MEQICTESGGVAKVNLHICKFAYYANVDHERITNLHSMQTCLIVGYCLVFFTLIMPGFTKVAFATSVDPDPMAGNFLIRFYQVKIRTVHYLLVFFSQNIKNI